MKYLGKIQDNKDLVTKEYVFGTNTFVAKYGETTWAEMDQAAIDYTDIVCVIDGKVYQYAYQDPDGYFQFKYTFGDTVFTYALEDDDTWSFSSSSINTDTKTSFYTTSSTAAATAAKTTSSVSNYTLREGNIISVKFTNANTANAPTLKVGSTTAKAIWCKGAVTSASNQLLWNAGDIVTFVYNGSIYEAISINTRALTDVTFVEYGVSTEAEVYAAQGNGKLVIAFDRNNVERFAPLTHYSPASEYVFSYTDYLGRARLWSLSDNGTNTWSKSIGNYYVPTTRTVNNKALSSDITLTASDVGALASDGIAGRSRRLQEVDSRNVNDTPADLISDPGAGVFSDFKTTTVIDTGEAPTKAYYQVISYVPWSNDSGGLPVQMALANKAGVPLIYTRSASSTSAWGAWKKLAFTDSDITGNAATADSAETLSATLGVGKGGTGKTSFTANQAIISGSTTTGAFTSRAITNNTATSTAITGSTNLVTMNTLRYAINRTTSVAAADTNYTTYMARGESLVTTDTTPTNNGEIAWVYG